MEWKYLPHFSPGEFYALADCPNNCDDGIVGMTSDPNRCDTCTCVRPSAEVPLRSYTAVVRESSDQLATVHARTEAEAREAALTAVQLGEGYNEKFTERVVLDVTLDDEEQGIRAAGDSGFGNDAGSEPCDKCGLDADDHCGVCGGCLDDDKAGDGHCGHCADVLDTDAGRLKQTDQHSPVDGAQPLDDAASAARRRSALPVELDGLALHNTVVNRIRCHQADLPESVAAAAIAAVLAHLTDMAARTGLVTVSQLAILRHPVTRQLDEHPHRLAETTARPDGTGLHQAATEH
jgi:hypothetical protein